MPGGKPTNSRAGQRGRTNVALYGFNRLERVKQIEFAAENRVFQTTKSVERLWAEAFAG
jgi:hypothetical protein